MCDARPPAAARGVQRAGQDAGPDPQTELLAIWWTARSSVIKRRQHLLTESEALLRELPLELVERLPSVKRVRPRLAALPRVSARRRLTPPAAARVRVLNDYRTQIAELDAQERQITRQLAELVSQTSSTLGQLCGLSTVSVAQLLVEVGDPRRFTERCDIRVATRAAREAIGEGGRAFAAGLPSPRSRREK